MLDLGVICISKSSPFLSASTSNLPMKWGAVPIALAGSLLRTEKHLGFIFLGHPLGGCEDRPGTAAVLLPELLGKVLDTGIAKLLRYLSNTHLTFEQEKEGSIMG